MVVRIGTAERGGTFHTQGLALKTVLARSPLLAPVEICESALAASVENAERLHAGGLEFGFMAANWVGRAKRGEAPFAAPIDLRVVAPMNAGPLFFIARADSRLRSVADLRGQRVVVGPERSGMAQHAQAILGALGITFSDIAPVNLDFTAGADALVAGRADAQLQCPIPNQVMTNLSQRIAVKVLPYDPGALDNVLAVGPHYRRTIMRKGAFRGLDADTAQIAVLNLLVTHARVDETLVHAAALAIASNTDELAALNPLFVGIAELLVSLRAEGPATLSFGVVALHPGAARAYRDAGLLT